MTIAAPHAVIKLLLIEDSDTDFLLLERHMHKMLAPIQVTRAANRTELTAALRGDYDLIVTDFHLPDAEGLGLLTMIAAAQGHTPCVLLSGSYDELESVQAPSNVIAKVEKGNHEAFHAALQKASQVMGVTLHSL